MPTAYESLAESMTPPPDHVKFTLEILEARATVSTSGGSPTATHALTDALTQVLHLDLSGLLTAEEFSLLKTSTYVALEWLDTRIKYGGTELTGADRDVIEVARKSIKALGIKVDSRDVQPLAPPFLEALRLCLITSVALLPNRSTVQSNELRVRIRELAPRLISDALAMDSRSPWRYEKLWILSVASDALAISLAPYGQKLVREVDHIKQTGSLTPRRFSRILRFLRRNGEPLAGPRITDDDVALSIRILTQEDATVRGLDLPHIAAVEHNRSRNGRGILGVFTGLKQSVWEAAVRTALIPLILTPPSMYLVVIIWRLMLGAGTVDVDFPELGRASVPGDVFAASIGLLAVSATILVALSVSTNDRSAGTKADFNQMAAAHRWWNRGQLLLILIAMLNLTLGGLSLLLTNLESSILPVATILIGALNWIMATSIETLEQSRNLKMATLEHEVVLMEDSLRRLDQFKSHESHSTLRIYTLLTFFFSGPLLFLAILATVLEWNWNGFTANRLDLFGISVVAAVYLSTPALFIVEAQISARVPVAIRAGQRGLFLTLGYGIELVLILLILFIGARHGTLAGWIVSLCILVAQASPIILFVVRRWPRYITSSPARLARIRLVELTQKKEARLRHSERN